jgi:prevent-host-death family protein
MQEMPLKDVKARLSEVVDQALDGHGSIITRHGKGEAVVISLKEYERLTKAVPSFGWLLANAPLEEGDLPKRRTSPDFGKDFL